MGDYFNQDPNKKTFLFYQVSDKPTKIVWEAWNCVDEIEALETIINKIQDGHPSYEKTVTKKEVLK